MNTAIRMRVVRIGNSRGIRLPKAVLEQMGIGAEIDLEVQDNQLVIRPVGHPRQGWEEQFRAMAERGDDRLLDPEVLTLTSWDEDEWEW